jgi:hypothetical protein
MAQLEQLENGEAAELAAALQPEEPVTGHDLCARLGNDLVRVGASMRLQLLATKLARAGMPPNDMEFQTIHWLGVPELVGELSGWGLGLAAVGPLCSLNALALLHLPIAFTSSHARPRRLSLQASASSASPPAPPLG